MNKTSGLRARLLGTSALAAAGSFMLGMGSPTQALAACTGLPASSGGNVVCSGYSYYSISENLDNLTVTLNASAALAYAYDPTVSLTGDDNQLILKNHSSIRNFGAYYAVNVAGDNFTVTLNAGSDVTLQGANGGNDKYSAVKVSGEGGQLTLNGASTVNTSGGAIGGGAVYHGVSGYGAGLTITLNSGSSVNVVGTGSDDNKYHGVYVLSSDTSSANLSSITLNGGSSVNVHSSASANSAQFYGILGSSISSGKYAPSIALNGGSSVNLIGGGGSHNKYLAVIGAGLNSQITLNGGSSLNVSGGGGGSNKYTGIMTYAGCGCATYAPQITLNDKSRINLVGAGGDNNSFMGILGITADQKVTLNGGSSIDIAGGGGNYNKYLGIVLSDGSLTPGASSITLNSGSAINITGGGGHHNKYLGVMSQGSYAPHIALNNSAITLSGSGHDNKYVGVLSSGYMGSVTLDDSTITLNSTGVDSNGFGIMATGDGTSVTLKNRSSIVVYGDNSAAIFLSSDGGSISIGSGASVAGALGIYADGDGNSISIAGTVIGSGGTAIDLSSATNSTLTLGTGADIDGNVVANTLDGDHLILQGHGVSSNLFANFDDLTVNGDGVWRINNDLDLNQAVPGTVTINSGTLAINGNLYADGGVTVNPGGTLGGGGVIYSDVLIDGTLSPGNSPGTLSIVGNVTLGSASTFLVESDGTASDLLAVTGNVTINGGSVVPVFLSGVDGFVGDILTATGTITGAFAGVGGAGVLDYSNPNAISLTAASPSSINGGLSGGASTGFTFLDTVLGQARSGIGRGKGLWGAGLWQSADRSADGVTKGFSQHSQGGAIGGDLLQSGSFTLGLAGGYIDSSATTVGGGTKTEIEGYNAALYGSWSMGGTFFTGAVNGAWQDQKVKRNVLSGGAVVAAEGSPDAWLGGAGFTLGHVIPIQQSWTITPVASLAWQHMSRDAYSETGGGLGGMSVGEVTSDTIRGLVGAELGLTIRDPNARWAVRPALRAGLAQEWRAGDDTVNGTFNASGAGFTAALDTRDQTYLAVGAGVDVVIGNGVTAFVSYDGGFGGDVEKTGGVRVGARLEW